MKPSETTSQGVDTIVLGGGVAGLAAAARLGAAGQRVVLLEARDRLGGRVHTVHDPAWPIPLERGAEFVHGLDPRFWDLLHDANATPYEVMQDHWHLWRGRLRHLPRLWSDLDKVLGRMPARPARDLSFRSWLARQPASLRRSEMADMATVYVEGFNAAHGDVIGIRSLAEAAKIEERLDATRMFRLLDGYDTVVDRLAANALRAGVDVRTRHVAQAVRWGPGHVAVRARRGRRLAAFHAARLLVTLPVGVLQAHPGSRGAVRFEPPLEAKRDALSHLRMGPVVRLYLRFTSAFWEQGTRRTIAPNASLRDMSFMHAHQLPFRTWWTMRPLRTSCLVGWAGGPAADAMQGKSDREILAMGLASLSTLFGVTRRFLQARLQGSLVADWQADPFARGAYSYAAVGGADAMKTLARPLQRTLYFAGEATQFRTMSATVPGAVESGWRAASEILAHARSRQARVGPLRGRRR